MDATGQGEKVSQLHFLRAELLSLIILLVILMFLLYRKRQTSQSWRAVIDPKLLPHLLLGQDVKQKKSGLLIFFLCGIVAIIALSGPVWEKLPQPVFEQKSALVVALDLSQSMNASDFTPSRLVQARHKLLDLLSQRTEGQTALIVYAANAFVVSPLTNDVDTIASMVSGLSSDIMPVQGSRADRAILKASDLLQQAGVSVGDILLITDGISDLETGIIESQYKAKHRLSIFSVATEQGAPIKLATGGFLKDEQGSIVVSKLRPKNLKYLSAQYRGVYQTLSIEDRDLHKLQRLLEINPLNTESVKSDLQADLWREAGPFLLLFLIPFAALAFRRGMIMFALILLIPVVPPAEALSWDELWQNSDQRAQKQLHQGENQNAAKLFKRPEWKAAAEYRAGNYDQALQVFDLVVNPTTEIGYNKANTLAKLGQLQQALDEYNKVLKQQPKHEDALFNKEQVEKALEEQKNQKQNNQNQSEQRDQKKQSSEIQQQDTEQKDSKKQNAESQDQQQQSQSSEQQKNKDQSQQDSQSSKQKQDAQKQSEEQQQAQEMTDQEAQENRSKQQVQQQLSQQEKLSKQAAEQWLRKIPDDPGGLLRRKFQLQYQTQQYRYQQGRQTEKNPW